jgi:hypothetical protein
MSEERNLTQTPKKEKGSSIYVPRVFKERVVALSKRYNKSQWRILLEALSLYETSLRKADAKAKLPDIEKGIWYIQKLAMSVGALKANPSDQNYQLTLRTISQVRDRLSIDTSLLEKAVQDFYDFARKNQVDNDIILELNASLKTVLTDIIFKNILKEQNERE